MAYKFKPNKGVLKRMKVTKTGKLKHRHEKNSHLRSGRDANLKRELGRASVLDETQARRFRKLVGIVGLRPNQTRHRKALAASAAAAAKSN